MAQSTCVHCQNTTFEIKVCVPEGSQYKVYLLQCSRCGGVVGAFDYHNIGALLHKLAKALKVDL